MHHRTGELHGGAGAGEADYLHHHDHFLCPALSCVAAAVSDAGLPGPHRAGVWAGGPADCAVSPAAEPLDLPGRAGVLGHLPQHPLCPAGPGDHRAVLSQHTEGKRPGLPLDVAHHCAEFRVLHPGGAVGRHGSDDRNADDSQDLRLCVDGADWLFGHAAGVLILNK